MVETDKQRRSSDFTDSLQATSSDPDTAETIVLNLVRQDPLATISELRDDVNRLSNGPDIGWWRVFAILRRNRLLTKMSRFKYMLGRR